MAKYDNLKLDTTNIVSAARELAQEQGVAVGNIGRVSVDVLANYFVTAPKTARELGDFLGIQVPSKGRLPKATARELAVAIR
jgi:hypothetical protein